jgi:hypothetical protein
VIKNPENYKEVREEIKRLLPGGIKFGRHAIEEMAKDRLDADDIYRVVSDGLIIEHRMGRWDWVFTLRGTSVDGETVTCAVAVSQRLDLVTAYKN